MGPLTMAARRVGLGTVLEIQEAINRAARAQGRPEVSLINAEEQARIEALIAANTWPQKWSGTEVTGDVLLPQVGPGGSVQDLLLQELGR
jgi:DNA sulfur modification protein DndC